MNKQFLSLLLLTSFVGTMSASGKLLVTSGQLAMGTKPVAAASALLGEIGARLAQNEQVVQATFKASQAVMPKTGLFSKMTGLMSAVGTKIAGLSHTSQYALGSIPVIGAGVATGTVLSNGFSVSEGTAQFLANWGGALGKSSTVSIRDAVNAARTPWYAKAGSAVAGYASAARVAASNGVQAVVASAQFRPKTAVAVGVVGAGALGYLGYKLYNRSSSHSISLNEQQKSTFKTALAEAKAFPMGVNVWSPVQPEQLELVERFTTAETGLPKKVVKALNEFVTLDGSCKRIDYLFAHKNGRTQPGIVTIYNATKPLRDAALAKLDVAAAA